MSGFSIKRFGAWIAIAIPPIAFYVLLTRSITKLPYADDYDSILQYLLKWHSESGFQHIVQNVTAQHSEYRLMCESAIFGIQYEILGHTNLEALSILGDLFVIPLFFVLYLIWKDFGRTGGFARWGLSRLPRSPALPNPRSFAQACS